MEVTTREFLYAIGIGTISLIAIAIGYIVSMVISQRRFIAKQRESFEQLRELSARIQTVREEERLKIAREIHDELGQMLTVAKMYLTVLPHKKNGKLLRGNAGKRVNAVVKMIDDSISLVKNIAYELRPIVLDDKGIKEAIEWEARNFQTKTGIACEFRSEGIDVDITKDQSVALFRIVQEAMTNVARHSGAKHVTIQLVAGADSLSLQILDDGNGIREESLQKKHSLGIAGMKERAIFLGGELTVSRKNGSGTIVLVMIPAHKGNQHEA